MTMSNNLAYFGTELITVTKLFTVKSQVGGTLKAPNLAQNIRLERKWMTLSNNLALLITVTKHLTVQSHGGTL